MVAWGVKISLQAEQCAPAVSPAFVQVGAVAGSVTSVCPSAGRTDCCIRIVSQAEQYLPIEKPASVQVGAIASTVIAV